MWLDWFKENGPMFMSVNGADCSDWFLFSIQLHRFCRVTQSRGGGMVSAEHEPIIGVWGQSAQQSPGAESPEAPKLFCNCTT